MEALIAMLPEEYGVGEEEKCGVVSLKMAEFSIESLVFNKSLPG